MEPGSSCSCPTDGIIFLRCPRRAAHSQGPCSHVLGKDEDGPNRGKSPGLCCGALSSPPPCSPASSARCCLTPQAPGLGICFWCISPGVSSCIPGLGALWGAWRACSTLRHFPAWSSRSPLLPSSPAEQSRGSADLHPQGSFESATF